MVLYISKCGFVFTRAVFFKKYGAYFWFIILLLHHQRIQRDMSSGVEFYKLLCECNLQLGR
jgi:hypothetical protein